MSKWDGELTTLSEGDLGAIGDKVHEVTWEAIDEAMSEQQICWGLSVTDTRTWDTGTAAKNHHYSWSYRYVNH